MKASRTIFVGTALAGLIGAGIYTGQAQATTSTISTTFLAQAPVAPLNIRIHGTTLAGERWKARLKTRGLTDGYIVDNKFLPGQTTGWHSHLGPSLIFVVAGSVTNYDSSDERCTAKTYSAGSSFVDEGGSDVHMLRNDSTTDSAETIAVQLIPSGQPRRVDKDEPANCHV